MYNVICVLRGGGRCTPVRSGILIVKMYKGEDALLFYKGGVYVATLRGLVGPHGAAETADAAEGKGRPPHGL